MKKRNLFSSIAAAVTLIAAFTSCSSDELEQTARQPQRINLTSSVTMTRATDATLQATQVSTNTKVGAFVTKTGEATATSNGNNVSHTVATNGDLTAASAMTFPESGNVDIYAYAPYNSAWTLGENNFSVNNDQSTEANYLSSDLIWATKADQASTSDAIALTFAHKLARVNITITAETGAPDLSKAKVTITNTLPSATVNVKTGEIGAASGTATDIVAVSELGTATSACAIIVPQKIVANTQFVKIETNETDNKTLIAKLGTETTFEGGKSYNLTVNVGSITSPTTEVTLKLGSTTITSWDDTNLGSQEAAEPTTYGIGDYLLADGTLVKANKLGDQTPAAIIFSTTVSATDAAAGYGAYAMALKRYKNRVFHADADNTAKMATGAGTWAQGLADLDGRTNTETMLTSAYYAARSDEEKAVSVINMSGFTPALSGTTNSGWFLPSFGQMVQIMNQFGEAAITETTVDDGDAIGSGSAFYTSAADALTTLVANMQANATKADADLFAVGSIVYATSTENNSTSSAHLQKFWSIQCAAAGTYAFGKNTQRGNNGRSVIPVTAVKLPTE